MTTALSLKPIANSDLWEKYCEAKDQGNLQQAQAYNQLFLAKIPSSSKETFSSGIDIPSPGVKKRAKSSVEDPLQKIEEELRAIEKQPEESALKKLAAIHDRLLEIEKDSPLSQPTVDVFRRDLFFLYSLLTTLRDSKPVLPSGGKLILASFSQFSQPGYRSSCAANVAVFAKEFLSLKDVSNLDKGWVEKVTREGMSSYTTLLQGRKEEVEKVAKSFAEQAKNDKQKEWQSRLDALEGEEREALQKEVNRLAEAAAEASIKSFRKDHGGDHLAMAEVSHLVKASSPTPPATTLLSKSMDERTAYFQQLLESSTKQADPKLVCSLTCNGYTYGVGIQSSPSKTFYVLYDSHGHLALNSSKDAFCIIYEDVFSAARYLSSLVSYLDVLGSFQGEDINRITYMVFVDMVFVEKEPLVAVPPLAFGKAAWEEYFGAIGEEPPLPADLERILDAPCPFIAGKKVKDTHTLTLVPAQVNEKPLTLQRIGELVTNPKRGHKTQYRSFNPHGHEGAHVKESTWVLMLKEPLAGSQKQTHEKQLALLAGSSYEIPSLIEAAVSLFVHYVERGQYLHGGSPLLSYTRCQERSKGDGAFMTIGHFIDEGLFIGYDRFNDGITPVRRFAVSTAPVKKALLPSNPMASSRDENLVEELFMHLKNQEYAKGIKTLRFTVHSLSNPSTTTLSALYEALRALLPHLNWTQKDILYDIFSKLTSHPFSKDIQASLFAAIADWHLSHKQQLSPAQRVEAFYLPAAHYYTQSLATQNLALSSKSAEEVHQKASTLFQHLFEDVFPLYQEFIQAAMRSKDFSLLETSLTALNHCIDAFCIPRALQEKYLSPLNEQMRDFLLDHQTLPNHSALRELAKNLSPHAPPALLPTKRLASYHPALSAETSTSRFIAFFQKTYLPDTEALNPSFTRVYDWRLTGDRGYGCALPYAPFISTLVTSEPSLLKSQESILKLLFILSGAHTLEIPHVTLKHPEQEIPQLTIAISESTIPETPSLLLKPPKLSLIPPEAPSQEESQKVLKAEAERIYNALSLKEVVSVEAEYRNPLHQLLYALAAYYGIPQQNPHTLLEMLLKREVFTEASAALLKQALVDLDTLCTRLHLYYKQCTSRVALYPQTLSNVVSLTHEETAQLSKAYFLILKPLSYALRQEKEPTVIDLCFAAIEEAWWKEEQEKGVLLLFIPLLVDQLHQQKAPFKTHQTFYQKLSGRSHLDSLRSLYYHSLEALDPTLAAPLAAIPNRKGVRLSQQLELQELTRALKAFTTETPPSKEQQVAISIKGGGLTGTRYLKPELVSHLVDLEGNLLKQYKDSLHRVCRLKHEGYDLHFKQKPSQPMMEYSVYSLTKRLVGRGAPPSTLLRFELKTPQGIKIYPVLASATAFGTNLKDILQENPKYTPNPEQATLLALSQLLTRPGDGRASNYIVTKDNDLVCIDNDVSFVEPIVDDIPFQKVHFCSILFCLEKGKLDQAALNTFIQTDPDMIIEDWLGELMSKEKEYQELFSPAEKERLYTEDGVNRFTPSLLLRSGAITNLYTQYLHLQHTLRERAPTLVIDLLDLFITLTGQNLTTQTLGPRIAKQYKTPQDPNPEQRLQKATERRPCSMTTKQHLGASLGKTPTAQEIDEREEFSLEKTAQEFLAYSLLRHEQVQMIKKKGSLSSLTVDFSRYTQSGKPDLERQSLILGGLKMLFAMQKSPPTAITFTNCLALTPEKLAVFLHKNLTYLNIRGSGLTHLPNELDTAAPDLEELYLSGSKQLETVQKNWIFSSEAFELSHLKVLHMAHCPKLTSAKIEAFVSDLKANNNPNFKLLECNVIKDINITECPKLQWKGFHAFGKASWAKYFGDIGEEPPLPPDIATILSSSCPIWSGKQVRETHLLTLVPATINGARLTLQSLGELVKTPKEGQATKYSYWAPGGNEKACVEKNTWVLLTRDVLPRSRSQSYDKQVALVWELANKAKVSYAVPRVIEVTTSLLMHYVRSGERLYTDSPWTYTRCQEKYNDQWPMAIGGFAPVGLDVDDSCSVDDYFGVGALGKL